MNCPKCQIYMDLKSYNGFDVNWCYKCSGVWVDYKNLLEMLGQTLLLPEFEKAMDNTSDETIKKCPSCKGSHLKEMSFKSCILDLCPSCKGVYFDSGELRKTFPYISNSLQGISDDDKLWNQTLENERMSINNPFINAIMHLAASMAGVSR